MEALSSICNDAVPPWPCGGVVQMLHARVAVRVARGHSMGLDGTKSLSWACAVPPWPCGGFVQMLHARVAVREARGHIMGLDGTKSLSWACASSEAEVRG